MEYTRKKIQNSNVNSRILEQGHCWDQGWASQAIFRVESSPSHFEILSSRVESESFRNTFESSRVESPVFPSRVKSSQIIFSIISFSVYFDKNINNFFMTDYPFPSFYTQKNKNSPTEDKMT